MQCILFIALIKKNILQGTGQMKQHKFLIHLFLLAFLSLVGSCENKEDTEQTQPTLLQPRFSEYFTVEEFLTLHPEQRGYSKEFSKQVRSAAIPLRKENQLIKIAIVYPGNQVSDYWRRSIQSFRLRMDELKIKYKIFEYFTKPQVEFRLQEQQIQNALVQDPDYLIFTLDAVKHKQVIERMITKGRPKLILQNITTPIQSWEGKQPFLYVGFDHTIGTEILADYFIKKTENQGSYGLLYFTQGYVSEMRGDTFIQHMQKNSNLKLVASYYTNGNRQKAKEAALELLSKHPQIKFIYACSTDVALGALDALQEANRSKEVLVNGWGGGSAELQALLDGRLHVTVMRMNDDNGVAMAESIRLSLQNKETQIPTIYSGDFELVLQGIDQSRLDQLQLRAFRYSDR